MSHTTMYRSASPYQAGPPLDSQYNPRSYSPAPGAAAVVPGSITYTTSTGPDGRTIYHPFKAVAASYQTPSGVVSGIQWVPAEATQILPAGAQPATSDFSASWSRGRDDEKALSEWGRDEEKRRRKDEKEAKRLREQGTQSRMDQEAELRKARERDAQVSMARERRKSVSAGVAGGAPGSYAFPTAPSSTGYPAAQGYPSSPYSGYGDRPPVAGGAPGYAASSGSTYARERKYSTGDGYPDVDRQFNDLNLDRNRDRDRDRDRGERDREREREMDRAYERERKSSVTARPRKYSTSEAGGERSRAVSGNLGARPEGYNTYNPATGPYNSSMRSFSGAGPPHQASPNMRASPNLRPGEAPYIPANISSTGYPGSSYSSSPARGHGETLSRSTTPFGSGAPPAVYPRGHVMEGQPIPRSRAPSPMPGAMGPPAGPYSSGSVAFPQAGTSPNMSGPIAFPAEPPPAGQLAAPEGFSRPVNAIHPFPPFDIIKVQDMEKFWTEVPRMPAVLVPHDVFEADWARLMQDLALAWAGKLPVPEIARSGRPPKRSQLIADLVDLWNTSFFLVRGAELVLYKGKERCSGPHAGVIDRDLPYLEEPDDYPSSSDDEDEDSEDSDSDYAAGKYNVYGRPNTQQQLADVFEAGRRRKEAKLTLRAERRRRRHERNHRRREKYRERKYSLYLTYVPTGVAAGGSMNAGMPGSYGGGVRPAGGGYGMRGGY